MFRTSITTIFLLCATVLLAQDDVPVSAWAPAIIKADGNPEEWHRPLRFYDNSTRLLYAISNDDKNLYFCFQTPDEINQQKIMRAGIKITLLSKTGDNRKASILFPLAQQGSAAKPAAGADSATRQFERKNRKENFMAQNTLMEVKGFADRNGAISTHDSSGINTAISLDESGQLTYEIAVPFAEFPGVKPSGDDLAKNFTLEVEVNAVASQNRGGNGGGGMGGMGGGRRMGGGGMGRGGGMGGGGMNHRGGGNNADAAGSNSEPFSSRAAMFEKGELKQKFVLAARPSK